MSSEPELDQYELNSELAKAEFAGNADSMISLIARGARMENRNELGFTPLKEMRKQFMHHVILPAMVSDPRTSRLSFNNLERIYMLLEDDFKINPIDENDDKRSPIVRHLDRILFPALVPRQAERIHEQVQQWRQEHKTPHQIEKLLLSDKEIAPLMQQYLKPIRLAKCWNHPAIGLPVAAMPLRLGLKWHPLMKDFTASNGITVTALTSNDALEEESKQLNHCVGRNTGYDEECCRNNPSKQTHILSLSRIDRHGRTALSTVEVRVADESSYAEEEGTPIAGKSQSIYVQQHKAYDNEVPPDECKQAWHEFTAAVARGDVQVATKEHEIGETEASIENNKKHTAVERLGGYTPTIEQANMLFDRFRMSERAAITGVDATGYRIYDTQEAEAHYPGQKPYRHHLHFIDGSAIINDNGFTGRTMAHVNPNMLRSGERLMSLRDLDIQQWLDATGLRDVIRKEIGFEPVEKAPVPSAGELRPIPTDHRPQPHIHHIAADGRLAGDRDLRQSAFFVP